MILKADIVFSEQLAKPAGLICKAGHVAHEQTRWYKVSGNLDPQFAGVYCETCVAVAFKAGRAIRAKNKAGEAQRESQSLASAEQSTSHSIASVPKSIAEYDMAELLEASKFEN